MGLRLFAVVASTAWLLLACASGGGGAPDAAPPEPAGPSALAGSARIGSVRVVTGDEMPAGDHRDQFEQYDAGRRLRLAIIEELQAGGHYAEGGALALRVVATDFRLRTGSSAFWAGGMAGSDSYHVRVALEQAGEILRAFETDTSTILGGALYASPTKRSERMIRTLSKRVVAGL